MLRRVRGLRHRRRNHEQRNSNRESKREHHTVSTFKSGTRGDALRSPSTQGERDYAAVVNWRAAEIR